MSIPDRIGSGSAPKAMKALLALILCASAFGASSVATLNVGTFAVTGVATAPTPVYTIDTFAEGTANEFSIPFTLIDDPGNPPKENIYGQYVGDCDYSFRIMTYAFSEPEGASLKAAWEAAHPAGTYPISQSAIGPEIGRDNLPLTRVVSKESAWIVNWMNTTTGHQAAFNIDPVTGNCIVWDDSAVWLGGTNQFVHKDAFYRLPTIHEGYKAAQWDKVNQVWHGWGQGTDTHPTPVEGYFSNGSQEAGTAVYGQRLFAPYPEWDSYGNVCDVTLTTSGGAVTGISVDALVSGHVVQEDTSTVFNVTQGANTTATFRVATYQTWNYVPGTFTNYVGGSGYSNGAATVSLAGHDVDVTIFTSDGAVIGAIPLAGYFVSEDYTTDLDIVQAGGSGATCVVYRYAPVRVPATFTIVGGGSGYSDGAAEITLQDASWYPDLEPVSGISYYQLVWGTADVDRAGGPSPFGVVGMLGNVGWTTCTEADFTNDGSTDHWLYRGGWYFRGSRGESDLNQWVDMGSETANHNSDSVGSFTNGFRFVSKTADEW